MIFKQIEEILNRTKTQTRRVLFEGEYKVEAIDGVIVAIYKRSSSRSCRWQLAYMVGKTYSIQPGRGQKAIEGKRIKVVALRVERVQGITERDAIKEGVEWQIFNPIIKMVYSPIHKHRSLCHSGFHRYQSSHLRSR